MCNLYFGYGSNLDEADFKAWCRAKGLASECLRGIGMAYHPDETLAFDYRSRGRNGGVLDIRPAKGCVVEGYLYEVTGNGWDTLDRKEGAPGYYRREPVTVLRPDGTETKAATYRVVPERREDFIPPATDYLGIMSQSSRKAGARNRNPDAGSAECARLAACRRVCLRDVDARRISFAQLVA